MLFFVPLHSAFDFLTFYVLLHGFGAGQALFQFQIGWFIESLTTQVLVVFAIRTRRHFFRSQPRASLVAAATVTVVAAVGIAVTPMGQWFGFTSPPFLFFAYLVGATAAYLALVEVSKRLFYRHQAST